jgi:hypothetical protein
VSFDGEMSSKLKTWGNHAYDVTTALSAMRTIQSARWHYISKTFTQYFRLMVIHVGIHGWQLAFTPEGVPPVTQQWMGLFCKERLIVDKYWRDRLLYAPNKSS